MVMEICLPVAFEGWVKALGHSSVSLLSPTLLFPRQGGETREQQALLAQRGSRAAAFVFCKPPRHSKESEPLPPADFQGAPPPILSPSLAPFLPASAEKASFSTSSTRHLDSSIGFL